ncbi:MAG: hypothetical protein ACKOZU_05490 [Planctomycetaceae bacterium]
MNDAASIRRFWAAANRLAAALSVAAVLAAGARADDDRVREGGASGEQRADEDGNLVDLGANFDANVFEQPGGGWVIRNNGGGFPGVRPGGDGDAGSPVLARVRAVGRTRLERVERSCGLTPEQRRKLEMALEADVRRCVGEVEEVRRGYAGVTVNMRDREGQQKWGRFQQDVQRCRRRLLTLFEESSLFAESLATVLDERQAAALAAETAARRAFRWKSLVTTALLRLDDMLALSQDEHAALERLLAEKEPALRLDPPHRQRNEQAEQMLVFMVLADVDQKALRAVVGDDRWKAVQTLSNQGRAIRSWIDGQGLLEPKQK